MTICDCVPGLVPARDAGVDGARATTRVAPTAGMAGCVEGSVGAGLVPARDAEGQEARATTRVAPTADMGDGAEGSEDAAGAGLVPARVSNPRLGEVVGAFKSRTTALYSRGVADHGWPAFRGRLWQRNYFDHIIRHEKAIHRLRRYIAENPSRWAVDRENPHRLPGASETP